ncbi:MAG: hypothetical protein CMI30_14055 [Opitutae bacterium]|nr:hypothetical protein [Opitutae bacterium]|tara:strand:- start:2251 stop:2982 length:732 start_codon:yes stop_codon:yes gene_type:complete
MKFSYLLLCFAVLAAPLAAAQKKALFLGNSYTAQSAAFIREVFKRESTGYEPHFLTPGGKDLTFHFTNQNSRKKLASAKWDVVFIQEQSQKAGLPGKFVKSFHEGANGLCAAIKKQGAKPCLFMTWGRRDGDKRNKHLFPDFLTMHGKISASYEKAAKENDTLLAPVGHAFAIIHAEDKALFKSLYKGDGSHPSAQGGYLVACVFHGVLSGKSPGTIRWNANFDAKTSTTLRAAAAKALAKGK